MQSATTHTLSLMFSLAQCPAENINVDILMQIIKKGKAIFTSSNEQINTFNGLYDKKKKTKKLRWKLHRITYNTKSCSFQTHTYIFCMNNTETRTDFSPETSEDWRESSYSGFSVFASLTTVMTLTPGAAVFTDPEALRHKSPGGEQPQPARWDLRFPHRCEHLQPIRGESDDCVTV